MNISGERITRQPEPRRADIRARNIGILLQSGNLVDHLSVEENILLPRFLAGKREDGMVDELLRAVGPRPAPPRSPLPTLRRRGGAGGTGRRSG